MRNPLPFIFIAIVIVIMNGCKKDKVLMPDCFPQMTTTRQIMDQQATVVLQNEVFYLIEQGTIDTRLKPCNLPQKYQIHNLQVTISGAVKSTIRNGVEPCCVENFVLTQITD